MLLVAIPDYFAGCVAGFRKSLEATSIFDIDDIDDIDDIEKCDLPNDKIDGVKSLLAECKRDNAKVCGDVLYQFMVGCSNDLVLPKVNFLTPITKTLTGKQEDRIIDACTFPPPGDEKSTYNFGYRGSKINCMYS
jgi:hypothetical protein